MIIGVGKTTLCLKMVRKKRASRTNSQAPKGTIDNLYYWHWYLGCNYFRTMGFGRTRWISWITWPCSPNVGDTWGACCIFLLVCLAMNLPTAHVANSDMRTNQT